MVIAHVKRVFTKKEENDLSPNWQKCCNTGHFPHLLNYLPIQTENTCEIANQQCLEISTYLLGQQKKILVDFALLTLRPLKVA